MMEMDKATQLVLEESLKRHPIGIKTVNIEDIKTGDVLAEKIIAIDDLPPFRASVMDGYAIKSQFAKVDQILVIVEENDTFQYQENMAVYVTTGGPVPNFFDAVIPIEETELIQQEQDSKIKILKQMNENQFIRAKGSDIRQGEIVLEENTVLNSAEIGLLATVGQIQNIKIYIKPKVGLISTGNELVNASTVKLDDGKIRDSNKLMLTSLLKSAGLVSEIIDYGIVKDQGTELDPVMQEASKECDVIISTGGVSMGELDLVKPYIEQKGKVIFGRLNMKPGKPTTFGILNKAMIFALPGNPVSSFVSATLFAMPALKILNGYLENYEYQIVNVQLVPSEVKLDLERPEYHRAIAVQDQTSNKIYAFSTGSQLSSRLLSAKSANCLVILPKGTKDQEKYSCKGQTQALLIGEIVKKNQKTLQEMLSQLQGQTVKAGCCEGHHHNVEVNKTHQHIQSQSANDSEQFTQGQKAQFKVGLITISDRASLGQYQTGDLSGKAMNEVCQAFPKLFEVSEQVIVPDEIDEIKEKLIQFQQSGCDLILTSGGTGFAQRDVTPEATKLVIDRVAESLSQLMINEACKIVPTACLSRGIIGMRQKTLIINLPGKPKAVKENMEILMNKNVLTHALGQLKGTDKH